jgi:hypothetical protein
MAYEDNYGTRAEQPIYPGVPNVFNLNPGLNVTRMWLELDATVTITGATGGALGTPIGDAAIANLAASRLIRRIKVLASPGAGSRYPKGPLVDCSPRSLLRFAMPQREGKLFGDLNGNGSLGNGANGSYEIFMTLPIYFSDEANLNGSQMNSTALNLNARDSQGLPVYSAVQVKVDIANSLTELFSGSTGDMAIAGMLRYGDKRLDLSGADTLPMKQEDHIAMIRGEQEQFPDQLLPLDGAFTQWLIMAEQNQPAHTLSDALIKRLEIKGNQLLFHKKWQEMRQAMLDEGFFDPSQTLTGLSYIDWTDGILQNSNAAAGMQAYYSVLNPSGSGLDQLRVYTRRVFGLA